MTFSNIYLKKGFVTVATRAILSSCPKKLFEIRVSRHISKLNIFRGVANSRLTLRLKSHHLSVVWNSFFSILHQQSSESSGLLLQSQREF